MESIHTFYSQSVATVTHSQQIHIAASINSSLLFNVVNSSRSLCVNTFTYSCFHFIIQHIENLILIGQLQRSAVCYFFITDCCCGRSYNLKLRGTIAINILCEIMNFLSSCAAVSWHVCFVSVSYRSLSGFISQQCKPYIFVSLTILTSCLRSGVLVYLQTPSLWGVHFWIIRIKYETETFLQDPLWVPLRPGLDYCLLV